MSRSWALPFVSLRWKFLLVLAVIMTLLTLSLGHLALRHFGQQRSLVLTQQSEFLRRDYLQTREMLVEQLASVARELNLRLGSLLDPQSELRGQWRELRSLWQLSGLHLHQIQGGNLLSLGGYPPPDDHWLAGIESKDQQLSRTRCRPGCILELATPITLRGKLHLLVLSTPLERVMEVLSEHHATELAILGPPQQNSLNPWNRAILSLTNRERNYPVLIAAAAEFPLEQLTDRPRMVAQGGRQWSLSRWPIDGGHLLLFSDVSELELGQRAYLTDLVGLMLLCVVATTLLGGWLLWRPLSRIQALQRLLPLLPSRDYKRFRERLAPAGMGFRDEVDRLEEAVGETADQLEQLHEEVDRYTHELERLAMMDTLTGLPNRTMMHHELSKSLSSLGRTDEKIALLFLDLDEFKRINDTLGHDVGDELLKTVANRLKKSVRSMDTVCRLGGDEFTVIIRGLGEGANIHRIIHQIFVSLQQPVQLGRHTLIVTTSIGVVFCDNPMERPEELLKRADLAMYQAKQAGRSNYRVFDDQMLELASRKLMLEGDLRRALEEGQMALCLQPILSIREQRVVGFESLVRWYHPSRGLLMPSEFMQDLEDSSEILALSDWVLKRSLKLLLKLTRLSGNREFYIAVNLSPHQYLHAGLGQRIEQLLQELQVTPGRLLLEVTEESLIRNLEQALATMERLKGMGVRIGIDDFGTGYSSLSYLKQLPFDILKIDRSFVRDLDSSDVDRNIVSSVIDLAHNLGRTVIAEGVESHDQLQYLLRAGCDHAQGYLFSPALDEQQVVELIRQLGCTLEWQHIESLQAVFHPLSGSRG
ncbi:EAL domain-containing protein [Ferrimonas sediminicola]|uniref:EAL domain-containing protein n=1 Tax=Ferrimonas sediminicola TaxID=2569538 RepID=A0A4V5NXH9_9GAMM|nr:EAL domain-containing protein [Ferrimonas sediminicola]TKB48628.1 EAL domain-containing protein [Ferrimonas sediminicola]